MPEFDGPLWVTGAGLSEAPARLLAESWAAERGPARFVAPSEFVGDLHGPVGALFVVSQGMSPNARLAVRWGLGHRVSVQVLTGAPDRATELGASTLAVPAEPEAGVRLLAPAIQTMAVFRLLGRTLDAHPHPLPPPPDDPPPVALVGGGDLALTAALRTLAWTALEGWRRSLGVYDGLGVGHGPLQALGRKTGAVWAFGRGEVWMEALARAAPEPLTVHRLQVDPDPVRAWLQAFEAGWRGLASLTPWPARPVDDRWLYGIEHPKTGPG